MTFVPAHHESTSLDLESIPCRRGIVEAYNRWAFSKEQEFKSVNDIEAITLHNDGKHVHVEWKIPDFVPFQYSTPDDMEAWIKEDPAAKSNDSPAQVWVNGAYEGTLNGEMSLFPILIAIKRGQRPGTRLCAKRYSSGLIRIEKYFRGMLRKDQIFEHVMDNLITLEDPEVIDSKTLIGTATLPDWIMGGSLTSRLHVQELETGDLSFTRPLYDDDTSTADRHFGLFKGRDDVKIAIVKKELERLRILASLKHPFAPRTDMKKESSTDINVTMDQPIAMFNLGNVPDAMDDPTDEELSTSSSLVFIPGGENDGSNLYDASMALAD